MENILIETPLRKNLIGEQTWVECLGWRWSFITFQNQRLGTTSARHWPAQSHGISDFLPFYPEIQRARKSILILTQPESLRGTRHSRIRISVAAFIPPATPQFGTFGVAGSVALPSVIQPPTLLLAQPCEPINGYGGNREVVASPAQVLILLSYHTHMIV